MSTRLHVGWTRPGLDVLPGVDADDGPTSVRGILMDYDEVQIAGDGELFIQSPYQTWRPEDTRVVPFTIIRLDEPTTVRVRPGWGWAPSVQVARAQVTQRFGAILEENAAGDNVFFRVRKESK